MKLLPLLGSALSALFVLLGVATHAVPETVCQIAVQSTAEGTIAWCPTNDGCETGDCCYDWPSGSKHRCYCCCDENNDYYHDANKKCYSYWEEDEEGIVTILDCWSRDCGMFGCTEADPEPDPVYGCDCDQGGH